MQVTVNIPRLNVAEYHRPYVAIWVEGASLTKPTNLAVWYDVNLKKNEGAKWLRDMRQWWRKTGRTLNMPVDGISGATRAPGQHVLRFAEGKAPLGKLPAGSYELMVEAAREVARQLRLRDVGGIIVCDFIDMETKSSRDRVLQELRTHLGRDRARTKAFAVSELGLIEMTRQRVRQSHLQSMTEPCQTCHGTGRVFTPETIIRRMERSVKRMSVEGKRDQLVVRLHPDVAMYVLEQEPDIVKKLEKSVGFSLELRDDPLLRPDEFKLVVKGAGRDVTQQYAVA